jgi:SHOCT-like protein
VPSDEGKQILQLLAEGKIDVEQAYRLLRALGDVDERAPRPPREPSPPAGPPGPPGARGRILRIRVTEDGEQKVNVAIPLAIARIGKMKLASSGLVRGHLGKFGIDLDELLKSVDFPGKIVDIADDEDRVEIYVE